MRGGGFYYWELLRLAMKNYTAHRRLCLPSLLRPKLLARRFGLFGLFIVFLLSGPFLAQAQQAEPAPAITFQELADLAAVMEDEPTRAQLRSRIRALIATRKNTRVEPPVASAGARMIAALLENVKETSRQLGAAADVFRDVPVIFTWVQDQVVNPEPRQRWLDLIVKLALILLAGGVAEWLVRLVLGRPRRAMEERDVDSLWVRLPLLAGRTVLDLVPLAAFAGAAYVVAPMVRPTPQTQVVALTLINAYLVVGVILAGARIAVFGGPGERDAAASVIAAAKRGGGIDLVGKCDLPTAFACLKRCSLFVGNDSGLMHLAAASGIPSSAS